MRSTFPVLALTILSLIWCNPTYADTEGGSWLITPDQAALAPAQDADIQARGLSDAGPRIEILKPKQGELVSSPAEILVQFLPKTETID